MESTARLSLVECPISPFTVIVIPGLTRNPVFLCWIPAFAGMTTSEMMSRSVRDTALVEWRELVSSQLWEIHGPASVDDDHTV